MKAGSLILTVLIAALGVACVHLYRLLDAEREQTLRLAAQVQQLEAARTSSTPTPGLKSSSGPDASRASPDPTSVGDAGRPTSMDSPGSASLEQARERVEEEYANSPAWQKMMRESRQRPLWLLYGDLVKQLELPHDQAEQLIQLLADQRDRQMENVQTNETDSRAFYAAGSSIQAQTDAAVMSLLGPEGYGEYEKYKTTLTERNEINVLGLAASARRSPLTEEQRSRLLAAMLEEKASLPPPGATSGSASLADLPVTREHFLWFGGYYKRVRERFVPILTPEQMKEFDYFQILRSYATQINLNTPDDD